MDSVGRSCFRPDDGVAVSGQCRRDPDGVEADPERERTSNAGWRQRRPSRN